MLEVDVRVLAPRTIATLLTCGLCLSAQGDSKESPPPGIEAKLRATKVTMKTSQPLGVGIAFSVVAIDAKCNLYFLVTGTQAVTNSHQPRIDVTPDLSVVAADLNGHAGVTMDVTNMPAIELLDRIAQAAGVTWDIRDDGIVVDVSSGKADFSFPKVKSDGEKIAKAPEALPLLTPFVASELICVVEEDGRNGTLRLRCVNPLPKAMRTMLDIPLPNGITGDDIENLGGLTLSNDNRPGAQSMQTEVVLQPKEVRVFTLRIRPAAWSKLGKGPDR